MPNPSNESTAPRRVRVPMKETARAGPPQRGLTISNIFLGPYIAVAVVGMMSDKINFISNLLGVALLSLFCIEAFWKSGIKLSDAKPLIPFAFLVAFAGASTALNPIALSYYLTFAQMFLLLTIVFITIRSTGNLYVVAAGFLIGVMLLFPFASEQIETMRALRGKDNVRLWMSLDGSEGGTNPNNYGGILNYALSLAMLILLHPPRRKLFRFIMMPAALIGSMIILYQVTTHLGSRQHMVWAGLTLVGFMVCSSVRGLISTKFIIGALVGLALTFGAFNLLRNSAFYERVLVTFGLGESGSSNVSAEERTDLGKRALELWYESPVIGHGTDMFRHISGYGTYSHVQWGELLVSWGAVGFAAYYALHVGAVRKAMLIYFRYKNPNVRTVTMWIIFAFLGVFCYHMARPVLIDKISYAFLGAAAGMAYYLKDVIANKRKVARVRLRRSAKGSGLKSDLDALPDHTNVNLNDTSH